ncbi:hypothetical protein MAFF212519_04570 [Clavibacter michiganensis]
MLGPLGGAVGAARPRFVCGTLTCCPWTGASEAGRPCETSARIRTSTVCYGTPWRPSSAAIAVRRSALSYLTSPVLCSAFARPWSGDVCLGVGLCGLLLGALRGADLCRLPAELRLCAGALGKLTEVGGAAVGASRPVPHAPGLTCCSFERK